eukprot:3028815-Ditylum_brightwellii.AAC.1
MRNFPSDSSIQEWGCKQLWIQSWDDETSCAIGRVGGISSVVDTMLCHRENTKLQQYACEALQNLAVCNDYNRDVIVDHGGITAIADAMHDEKIILAAHQVLTDLDYNPAPQYVHVKSDRMEC